MSIKAYEMQYVGEPIIYIGICPIYFNEKYYEQYRNIYNACFHEMRKALNLQPYNCCDSLEELFKKTIFLFIENNKLIGAVSICENEIDDLIVDKMHQRKGYGKQLLLFTVNYLFQKNKKPIVLHVADWNKNAIKLYKNNGFIITKTEEY